MPRKIEKNAKSKEEALRLAAEEFGVPIEELSYTVEREIGSGILGRLLGREVIISAWITKEAEEEQRLREGREQRRQAREKRADKSIKNVVSKLNIEKSNPKQQPQKPANKAKTLEEPKHQEQKSTRVTAKSPVDSHVETKTQKNRDVTEKSIADAQYFVEKVIHMMGLPDAKVVAVNGGTAVDVTVSGEKMGLLIGKRGDTLDAVQYLTSLYVNREKNSYIKINVDTEGYRAKREETLVKLAHSLERRVLRERKPITLEPMSPNERRIIHSALQGNNEIKTYSVGDDPDRKVVVALQD